jgi:hypothetical protein
MKKKKTGEGRRIRRRVGGGRGGRKKTIQRRR